MSVTKRVDKKSPILTGKKRNKNQIEPVVKLGLKDVLAQLLQFVIVGGDFV